MPAIQNAPCCQTPHGEQVWRNMISHCDKFTKGEMSDRQEIAHSIFIQVDPQTHELHESKCCPGLYGQDQHLCLILFRHFITSWVEHQFLALRTLFSKFCYIYAYNRLTLSYMLLTYIYKFVIHVYVLYMSSGNTHICVCLNMNIFTDC